MKTLQNLDTSARLSCEIGEELYDKDRDCVVVVVDVNSTDDDCFLVLKDRKRSCCLPGQLSLPFTVEYEPSMTEPDLSYTPREIIENFMRGRPMNLSQNQEYDTDRYATFNENDLHRLNEFEDEFEALEYARLKDEEARRKAFEDKVKKKSKEKEKELEKPQKEPEKPQKEPEKPKDIKEPSK